MTAFDLCTVTPDDEIFSSAEVEIATLSTPSNRSAILNKASNSQDTLPKGKLSLSQQTSLLKRVSPHATLCSYWALQIGKRVHLTSYGMVGYTLLSSACIGDALSIIQEYGLLLNMKFGLKIRRDTFETEIEFTNDLGLSESEKTFWLCMDIAKIVTLLSELTDAQLLSAEIALHVETSSMNIERINAELGIPVCYNGTKTKITLAASQLSTPLPQSNISTYEICKELCNTQVQQALTRYNISAQVQHLLMKAGHTMPSLSEVAELLHLSPRTLRRRLDDLGTSYNALLSTVRKRIAVRYLVNTAMTTEEIAELLNYSDAANFRHAFKRWTGRSPREYRLINRVRMSLPYSGAERTEAIGFQNSYA